MWRHCYNLIILLLFGYCCGVYYLDYRAIVDSDTKNAATLAQTVYEYGNSTEAFCTQLFSCKYDFEFDWLP